MITLALQILFHHFLKNQNISQLQRIQIEYNFLYTFYNHKINGFWGIFYQKKHFIHV